MKNGVIVETMMISRRSGNVHLQSGRSFRYPQASSEPEHFRSAPQVLRGKWTLNDKSCRISSGACGAVGSALPWHGRGREFESHQVHQIPQTLTVLLAIQTTQIPAKFPHFKKLNQSSGGAATELSEPPLRAGPNRPACTRWSSPASNAPPALEPQTAWLPLPGSS